MSNVTTAQVAKELGTLNPNEVNEKFTEFQSQTKESNNFLVAMLQKTSPKSDIGIKIQKQNTLYLKEYFEKNSMPNLFSELPLKVRKIFSNTTSFVDGKMTKLRWTIEESEKTEYEAIIKDLQNKAVTPVDKEKVANLVKGKDIEILQKIELNQLFESEIKKIFTNKDDTFTTEKPLLVNLVELRGEKFVNNNKNESTKDVLKRVRTEINSLSINDLLA